MIGSVILRVWGGTDAFPVMETEDGWFEMRMGGVAERDDHGAGDRIELDVPFVGSRIKAGLSDEHWVYLITWDNAVIGFGWGHVEGDGTSHPAFFFTHGEDASKLIQELGSDMSFKPVEPIKAQR